MREVECVGLCHHFSPAFYSLVHHCLDFLTTSVHTMLALIYVCFLLHQVLSATSMNVPNNYDLFILTNRDINGIFALSFKPAANTNKATTMRNVSTGIKKFDEWYLDNNTITNNGYNDTILQFWTLHKESWGFVAWWNCTPQDDGTLQISAAGSFFLGLDDTKTQAKLHPLVDFGERGYGFWSMIPLPTVFVTWTTWVTSERSVAAKTSFLGGRVTSTFTVRVTDTQV